MLIETTDLRFTDVAFAAGFGSLRQFNDTVRAARGRSPAELRRRASGGKGVPVGEIGLRLALRPPFAADALAGFLGARAVPGVEQVEGRVIRRTLSLPHAPAVVRLELHDDHVAARLRLGDLRDLHPAVRRCRRLLDLDADPRAVDTVLGEDPLLAPLVRAAPGLRSPGAVDGPELAVRALVGQQVSVRGARTVLGRRAERYGERDGDDVRFPTAEALAAVDPAELPMPRARGRALVGLAAALAAGEIVLEPGADRAATVAALLARPGIGPWTASYVAMRALGDPDVLMTTDLGIRRALPLARSELAERGRAWSPWRSYATHHLWRTHG